MYFSLSVENEYATEPTSSKKTGTRSKKNRKRGKRKPGGEVVGSVVKSSASQDNKENHVGVNDTLGYNLQKSAICGTSHCLHQRPNSTVFFFELAK